MKLIITAIIACLLCSGSVSAESKMDKFYSVTFKQCFRAADGNYYDQGACADAESDRWDSALNASYRSLVAKLPAPRVAVLRTDERAWIVRRDHKCDHAGDEVDARDYQAWARASCRLDETILRTGYLKAYH